MRRMLLPMAGAIALSLTAGTVQAAEVEVLHWWTSGGEAAALNVLKKDLESKGVTWKDMPVAGGGGTQAMTVLRARVSSGEPPTAVQMLGFESLDWAQQGVLGDLNDLAAQEKWDAVVPAALQKFSCAARSFKSPSTPCCTQAMTVLRARVSSGEPPTAVQMLGFQVLLQHVE